VRRIAARALADRGYRVLEATDAERALQLLETRPGEVHLMVTDVVLPGLGGRQLAERVARSRPSIKVLFVSGYTDDVILQHHLVARDVAILQKPFTATSLSTKVREVLDNHAAAGHVLATATLAEKPSL
jgi:CheY-like chemotaxis protein